MAYKYSAIERALDTMKPKRPEFQAVAEEIAVEMFASDEAQVAKAWLFDWQVNDCWELERVKISGSTAGKMSGNPEYITEITRAEVGHGDEATIIGALIAIVRYASDDSIDIVQTAKEITSKYGEEGFQYK